jgi:nucleotide-binding universal stress UspA family protein
MKEKESIPFGKGAKLSLHAKPAGGAAELGTTAGLLSTCFELKKILVPIDFSDSSEKALRYSARFAEQFGSSVTLLHVIQPAVYPADFGYPPTVVDTLDEATRRQIQERLEEMGRELKQKTDVLVRLGQPYHEITSAAKELNADLIIIATHGRTGLKHVLMGSTAERVVRYAPCPVLTVREREHDFV